MNCQIHDRRAGWWVVALIASAAVVGCEPGDTGVLQPTTSEGRVVKPKVLSVDVPIDELTLAIQGEYLMQATYQRVLSDLGDVKPFFNIINSEGSHVAALSRLFTVNDLPVPASEVGELPPYDSVEDACAAAALAEGANATQYDVFLLLTLPDNVRKVFERLRAASLRHETAFNKCA